MNFIANVSLRMFLFSAAPVTVGFYAVAQLTDTTMLNVVIKLLSHLGA